MLNSELVTRLRTERVPFVVATVVRAKKPTSVRPGDAAVVLSDGSIDGFVGGVCAQESVRLHAAKVLETGEAVLLKLMPGLVSDERAGDGVVVAHNPCLSGGALEIFLEPQLVAPRIVIAGDTPIARALATIARAAEYDVAVDGVPDGSDAALIVASHGVSEEDTLVRAVEAGVSYVALVASPKRGRAVLESLDLDPTLIRTPAGLDIGARTPADVAISILAEIIASRTVHAPAPAATVITAVDPICGMEVLASDSSIHLDVDGTRFYFCCDGCRTTFAAQHSLT